MTDLREAYFDRVFHPHFVVVHLAGFVFGLHLAIASGFAIAHHARRATPSATAHATGHQVGV